MPHKQKTSYAYITASYTTLKYSIIMKTKLFTFVLALITSVETMLASPIKVDGIWYEFNSSKKTATVTQGNSDLWIDNLYFGSVIIPSDVTYDNCTYRVKSIGEKAFYMSDELTSVEIPNSVTSIEKQAFLCCYGLTSITIPNSVIKIGDEALSSCPINEIHFNGSIEEWCNKVWSPQNMTLWGYDLYINNSKVENLTIPSNVSVIESDAFYKCTSLTSVNIPGVELINDGAFLFCALLESVTIGNKVTSIGKAAFSQCGLTSVTIRAEVPPTLGEDNAFPTYRSDFKIFVPCNAVNAYRSEWKNLKNLIYGEGGCESYIIKFKNWDGTVLQSTSVSKGEMPQYTGATPTRLNDDQYSYTFSGWSPQIVAATADATYIAQFTAKVSTCEDVQTTWLQTGGNGFGSMTTDNSDVWTYSSKYGAVGKKQGGATGWLMTPPKDMRGMKSAILTFSHTHKYAKNLSSELTLWMCGDYKGSVGSSTWEQLTISPYASNNDWTYVKATINVPLDKVGKNTVFGFKYVSTSSNYSTWEIKDVTLESECENTQNFNDIEELQDLNGQYNKILRNGQILILRGDKVYTLQGQEVK
jgi:hypothetical protein